MGFMVESIVQALLVVFPTLEMDRFEGGLQVAIALKIAIGIWGTSIVLLASFFL